MKKDFEKKYLVSRDWGQSRNILCKSYTSNFHMAVMTFYSPSYGIVAIE